MFCMFSFSPIFTPPVPCRSLGLGVSDLIFISSALALVAGPIPLLGSYGRRTPVNFLKELPPYLNPPLLFFDELG